MVELVQEEQEMKKKFVCRKKRFRDKREAEKALHYAISGRTVYGNKSRKECRMYYCEQCKAWHLTSKENRV